MLKVILASRSKARKKLLRQAGISFRVAASNVRERRGIKTSCQRLVIDNALAKAKDVAKRFKKGIIVAADTVVLFNGKIIGKPKSIREAHRTLKMLSRRPQWVYTGIAVIDTASGRVFTDHDKTKIHMARMTDKEISDYYKKTSPLDKAGGFDIQDKGARFIRRVDGCLYNVVGLPMLKLLKILKNINREAGK